MMMKQKDRKKEGRDKKMMTRRKDGTKKEEKRNEGREGKGERKGWFMLNMASRVEEIW